MVGCRPDGWLGTGPGLPWRLVRERPRILIDWDHEASGIWRVGDQGAAAGWKGWSTVLSTQLLADLKSWNDHAAQVDRSGDMLDQFSAAGHDLAHRVQDELGDGWDVLYNPGGAWAWSWVDPPWRSTEADGSPTPPMPGPDT
jgi:hypothetical protein